MALLDENIYKQHILQNIHLKILRRCYLCFKYKGENPFFETFTESSLIARDSNESNGEQPWYSSWTTGPKNTRGNDDTFRSEDPNETRRDCNLSDVRDHADLNDCSDVGNSNYVRGNNVHGVMDDNKDVRYDDKVDDGSIEGRRTPSTCLRSGLKKRLSSFVLLVTVLLAGLPSGIARGGKGAKGAGGGATRYGFRGVHNAAAYEMTWEDIVLAMQLSAMCFGALIALCIVTCCAYKICGPAEEEDFRSYRPAFRQPRIPPELYREIYTLPGAGQEKPLMDSGDAPPGSMTPHLGGGVVDDPSGLLNGRGRTAGGRLVGGTGRAGVAPRLAQHLHNSSLDLTCPPGGVPSDRALSEPRQNPV
ncbi:uncharacterized protein LOC108680823 [Hyalella azteca]|uniref:Uncharacterized protein LOC108680823 n=1 Tax=Hyalella azteca TaxID=294128 RepID=A0A8B7PIQ7_HYAAZ|nr:uncharacterized protein LOC108680823 [Hyalella azteca]